ncbi:aminopeptidase Ey-like [Rhipicephalus microplus]|uniref:aminopeptidase Ey-like n=1 Tax=Rhipicephalus microplus TaxID=6941 RepID=UPI003F6B6102
MLIIKAVARQFIPPRTYMVSISFSGQTGCYPEQKTGLVYVRHDGGYESIMFLNEGRASRAVFPSFNRHSYRAGFRFDGLVRRGMVLVSSERPLEGHDDELVENKGGPNDVFRVRFTTIDAITSDRLTWFQTNLANSVVSSRLVMWNTAEKLSEMIEPLEVFEKSFIAVTTIYPSLTFPSQIHVVSLPNFNATIICWGVIYSASFEGSTANMLKYQGIARRLRFQFQSSTMLASFTFGLTITPRWANDIWFFAGLSAAVAYDTLEELEESFGHHKTWLISYRQRALKFSDAMNRLTPDTFNFFAKRDETMMSNAFLLILIYKDCLLGRKKFQQQVRDFISKYKFTTTNSDSAVNILTSRSTYQKAYFDTWANKHGHPVIIVQLSSGSAASRRVLLRQMYFRDTMAGINDTWVIPLLPAWVYLNGSHIKLARRLLIGNIDKTLDFGPMRPAVFIPYFNVASVARVLYDSYTWALVFAVLDSPQFNSIPVVNRAALQQDLGAFLRNGDVGLTLYIAGIRYIWRETSRAVWRAFALEYREIREAASTLQLGQLDSVVGIVAAWHKPVDMDKENATFDMDTRDFYEDVLCLASGSTNCTDPSTKWDEWSFDI